MTFKEELRLKEIDKQLDKLNGTLSAMVPIFNQVDRKIRLLRFNMDILEKEKAKLTQGQLMFDSSVEF